MMTMPVAAACRALRTPALAASVVASLLIGTPALVEEEDRSSDPYSFAIHSGACGGPFADPLHDLGALEPVLSGGVDETGGTAEAADNQTVIDEDIEGDQFFSEDTNNNGLLEPGEDVNGNGVIDEATDLNADGELNAAEIAAMGPASGPQVLAGVGEAETDLQDLTATPHVVVAWGGPPAAGTPLACGEIVATEEDGRFVVVMRPVEGSDAYGVAVFDEDDGAPIVGDTTTSVDAYLFRGLVPVAGADETTPRPGTPMPGTPAAGTPAA